MDLAVDSSFFDNHGEGLKYFFHVDRKFRSFESNIVNIQAILLNLHLTQLRLYFVLQDLPRAPDDLQELSLLVSEIVVTF